MVVVESADLVGGHEYERQFFVAPEVDTLDGEAWGSRPIGHSRWSLVVPGRMRVREGTDWVVPIDGCIRPLAPS